MKHFTEGTTQIEIYRRLPLPESPTASFETQSLADEYQRRADLCKAVGLTVQANRFLGKKELLAIKARIPFPHLRPSELRVWEQYLPTRYSDQDMSSHSMFYSVSSLPEPFRGDGSRHLRTYNFDTIPFTVLEQWKVIKEAGWFDYFVIRTPEHPRPDPILLGCVKADADTNSLYPAFLIARWGESLKPFEEIKREVQVWKARDIQTIQTENVAITQPAPSQFRDSWQWKDMMRNFQLKLFPQSRHTG